MRRMLGDAVISVAALIVLLLVLAAVDARVRDTVTGFVHGGAKSAAILRVGRQARDISTMVVDAAWDQSMAHGPLVIFTLAATVLVLFMVRT